MNTLCWNCNHEYDLTMPSCPACDATNGNIDLCMAYAEIGGPEHEVAKEKQICTTSSTI